LATRQEARELSRAGADRLWGFLADLSPAARRRVTEHQLIPNKVVDDARFMEERLVLLSELLERVTGHGLEWEEE
jgi:hypothetical protein